MCPGRLNKGLSSKFHNSYSDRATAEEGRRTHERKRCHNNNKNKDIIPKVNFKKDYSIKPSLALRTASETTSCSDVMALYAVHNDTLQEIFRNA